MNLDRVAAIARAVLYEGYILYPYRPSAIKNRQRWTFGGVFPRGYAESEGGDSWHMQTQCLLRGNARGCDRGAGPLPADRHARCLQARPAV